MKIAWLWVAAVALVPAGPAQCEEQGPTTLDAGPLKLEIHVQPRTAMLFHVVDQLSGWSEFCHGQYKEYFKGLEGGLSEKDREMLAKHAAVRRVHDWGNGLEQTFYTPADLETALKRGVEQGHLTEQQAAVEQEVFAHFAPRIEALMKSDAPVVEAFAKRLMAEQADLRRFAKKAARFCGSGEVSVPVFLLANPADSNCGGGYNGGRLTLEIPRKRDVYNTFLHEIFHAFLRTQQSEFEKAARGTSGLDAMTLNEGIAYALSPGLLHSPDEGDPLLSSVRNDIAESKAITDNYTRFRRLGLALRPLLRDALDDENQTLATFLPRAVDAWRVVVELDGASKAAPDGKPWGRAIWFSAGPGWRDLGKVARSLGLPLKSYNHSEDHYRKILSESQPGSTVVLLFALDHSDKNIPENFQDLLPMPWSKIEAALKKGETVEASGKAREREIVLLAAPTESQLNKLIQETKLLSPNRPKN